MADEWQTLDEIDPTWRDKAAGVPTLLAELAAESIGVPVDMNNTFSNYLLADREDEAL
jgi:hypothetical protein